MCLRSGEMLQLAGCTVLTLQFMVGIEIYKLLTYTNLKISVPLYMQSMHIQ